MQSQEPKLLSHQSLLERLCFRRQREVTPAHATAIYDGAVKRIAAWLAIALATIATYFLWKSWYARASALTYQELTFQTSNQQAQIKYQVQRSDPTKPAICVIQALNIKGEVLGETKDVIPAGTQGLEIRNLTFPTSQPAGIVRVAECQLTK